MKNLVTEIEEAAARHRRNPWKSTGSDEAAFDITMGMYWQRLRAALLAAEEMQQAFRSTDVDKGHTMMKAGCDFRAAFHQEQG